MDRNESPKTVIGVQQYGYDYLRDLEALGVPVNQNGNYWNQLQYVIPVAFANPKYTEFNGKPFTVYYSEKRNVYEIQIDKSLWVDMKVAAMKEAIKQAVAHILCHQIKGESLDSQSSYWFQLMRQLSVNKPDTNKDFGVAKVAYTMGGKTKYMKKSEYNKLLAQFSK